VSDAGLRNDNLAESTATYIKGATWKKQRGICLLPAGSSISTRVALAWRSMILPPNQAWHFMAIEGCEVGDAYNRAIEGILAHPDLSQWEYILCCEHDNLMPSDGVLKLIKALDEHPEYSAVSGLYWTKGEGGVPQIWGDPSDPVLNFRPQPPKPGELVECCGTGQGFGLFIEKPWFVTKASAEGVGTQDLHFWSNARKRGHRCAVDCSVLVGHLDISTNIVW
jgi:hypothetical protein